MTILGPHQGPAVGYSLEVGQVLTRKSPSKVSPSRRSPWADPLELPPGPEGIQPGTPENHPQNPQNSSVAKLASNRRSPEQPRASRRPACPRVLVTASSCKVISSGSLSSGSQELLKHRHRVQNDRPSFTHGSSPAFVSRARVEMLKPNAAAASRGRRLRGAMTGCSCLKNELSGMVWAPGERECTLGVPSRMSSPLASFTCVPAPGPAQPAKTILKILKTPRRQGNRCISRLNGGPSLLAGQAGLILNILKTLSSPEPAGDYRALMEVLPENIGAFDSSRGSETVCWPFRHATAPEIAADEIGPLGPTSARFRPVADQTLVPSRDPGV